MKVAIVTSEIGNNGGGLSYSCLFFAEMIENFGYEVIIISSVYDNTKYESCKFRVIANEIEISEGGYKPDLKEHLFFRGYIKNIVYKLANCKLDFIFSFGAGFNGLLASELAKLTNTKFIVLLRGSEINLSKSDTKLLQYNKICIKQANSVVALSNELIEVAKDIYYSSNIHYQVIPNITECSDNIELSDFTKEQIILGCGAKNLNEKKGIANLITMLFYLNQSPTKQFRFEFSGHIDNDLLQIYKNHCKKLRLSDKVTFLGDLSREKFIKKLKNWDFYIQGSFCEGFSNSIGDCLKIGKPFIISNSGFIAESILKYTNEIVFENFIPQKMSKIVLNIIENKDINQIYKNAYKQISENTNSKVVISNWQNLLHILKNLQPKSELSFQSIISVVFHDISNSINSNIDTELNTFISFVETIFNKGFKLCSAKEYFLSADKTNLIICTFDDAYENVYKLAFPILQKYNFTATIFVCADYIAKTNDWNFKDTEIRKHLSLSDLTQLKNYGWEIGSHGKTHKSLLRLSDNELIDELVNSKTLLEYYFGTINSYAYPYGDFNDYVKNIVSANYKFAFTLSKGGNLLNVDNFQIRRYFVSELLKLI